MTSNLDHLEKKIESLQEVFDQYVAIERSHRRPKNMFSILDYKRDPNTTSREMSYQFALKYFLNPNEPHGFGDLVLDSFLELVSERDGNPKDPSIDHIKIDKEVAIEKNLDDSSKRIDLVVASYKNPANFEETPEWLMLIELKVGASENKNQTKNYAEAEKCYPSWVEGSLNIDEIDDQNCFYIYVKRSGTQKAEADKENGDKKGDDWHKFDSINWAEIVDQFDKEVSTQLLGKPHRSVVQFSDFMDSLKGEEDMADSTKKSEMKTLNDMLKLYLNNKELLDDGLPNLQAEIDDKKENFVQKIRENWAGIISENYEIPLKETDGSDQGWVLNAGENEWQRIQPQYWIQDVGKNKPVNISFVHLVDEEVIFQEDGMISLKFGFRLPSQRGSHTKKIDGKSFNKRFQEEVSNDFPDFLENGRVAVELNSANEIFSKTYSKEIDADKNIYDLYIEMLKDAIDEFCIENSELSTDLNDILENVFSEFYSESQLDGSFPGPLTK